MESVALGQPSRECFTVRVSRRLAIEVHHAQQRPITHALCCVVNDSAARRSDTLRCHHATIDTHDGTTRCAFAIALHTLAL